MQCPYCKKDLSNVIRLLGNEVFSIHVRIHEVDIINQILEKIASVDWYYSTQKSSIMPGIVEMVVKQYHELMRFYKLLEESQNENSKEKEIS